MEKWVEYSIYKVYEDGTKDFWQGPFNTFKNAMKVWECKYKLPSGRQNFVIVKSTNEPLYKNVKPRKEI